MLLLVRHREPEPPMTPPSPTEIRSRILSATTTEAPLRVEAAGGTAVLHTSACPVRDRPNEDSLAWIARGDSSLVALVADGIGGHAFGGFASRTAAETFVRRLRAAPVDEETGGAIVDAFDAANRAIIARGTDSGTTAVVAEIRGARLRVYHCGDSGAIVVGGRGKIVLRTVDHSPTGYALEAGLLTPADALVHSERHVVSNYLGSSEMRVEVSPWLDLRPRDTLVLASDGLFDNLLDSEIAEIARRGKPEAAAARLVAIALERMTGPDAGRPTKPDDLTLFLFRRTTRRSSGRRDSR